MNVPKPAPPKPKPVVTPPLAQEIRNLTTDLEIDRKPKEYVDAVKDAVKEPRKTPYVVPEHLIVRPLAGNPALLDLKKTLEPQKQPVKRNPRRPQAKKTQEKKR